MKLAQVKEQDGELFLLVDDLLEDPNVKSRIVYYDIEKIGDCGYIVRFYDENKDLIGLE